MKTSKPSPAPLEWCVDFSDCLIVGPRNSWSMDAIAIDVSTATLEGMYVHKSWSAPCDIMQSSCEKFLYFDPVHNCWLFEPETPLSPVDSRTLDPRTLDRTLDSRTRPEIVVPTLQSISTDTLHTESRSEVDVILPLSPFSPKFSPKYPKEIEIITLRGGENDGNGDDNNDDDESSDDRKSKGSSRRSSMHSIATSMYESCDELDKFCETRSTDSGPRSQKSRMSSHDGHEDDLFFDTYDESPGKIDDKKSSVRFTIPPIDAFSQQENTSSRRDGNGDYIREKEKERERESGRERERERGHDRNVHAGVPTVNRIVLTLRKTDVYVSLSGPLHNNREDDVEDEVREFGEVSHHSPVYRVIKKEVRRPSATRGRDRTGDGETVTVQR